MDFQFLISKHSFLILLSKFCEFYMGTSLVVLGNHSIRFENRTYEDIEKEIRTKLNALVLKNAEFLRLFALKWSENNPRSIREINETKEWHSYVETFEAYQDFPEEKQISCYGPFSLEITFTSNFIKFWDPPYRYWQWFQMEDEVHQNEWRKYFKQVLDTFGGNKVLYAADNSHFLNEYEEFKGTFKEMEADLFQKYGASKTSFQDMEATFYGIKEENAYFIDDFSSINWQLNEDLNTYLPEPEDTSSTEFDLSLHKTKEQLKNTKWDEEVILFKEIMGKMHFYHLLRLKGLLCKHTGVSGEKDQTEVFLDAYAPFAFDNLIEQLEKDGYAYANNFRFTLMLTENSNHHPAMEEFNKELLWHGIGRTSGSCMGKQHLEYFYCVHLNLAITILEELKSKFKAFQNIQILKEEVYWEEEEPILRQILYIGTA